MIILYRILTVLIVPFLLINLAIRGIRNRGYWYRWGERFGSVPDSVKKNTQYDLWVHAVSVGEARAAATLVQKLWQQKPDLSVVVTTTTPTGSETVHNLLGNRVAHCYMPYDIGICIKRFVRIIDPRLVLVLETELWPNLISTVKARNAGLIYCNVRLSERSYKSYLKIKNTISTLLQKVDCFAVQSELDAKHIALLGVDKTKIVRTGSIKFDLKVPASLSEFAELTRQQLGGDRLIWIAGSTREGEEQTLIEAHKELLKKYPKLLLVIVPRHPERFDLVKRMVARSGLKVTRHSKHKTSRTGVNPRTKVYLVDTLGDLLLFYTCADVAFVGGSLVPLGGQNVLEPCAVGTPVLFGPHMFNFLEISRLILNEKAGFMVEDKKQLFEKLDQILGNASLRDELGQRGQAFITSHQGASEKTVKLIKEKAEHIFSDD